MRTLSIYFTLVFIVSILSLISIVLEHIPNEVLPRSRISYFLYNQRTQNLLNPSSQTSNPTFQNHIDHCQNSSFASQPSPKINRKTNPLIVKSNHSSIVNFSKKKTSFTNTWIFNEINNYFDAISVVSPLLTSFASNISSFSESFNFPINEDAQYLHIFDVFPQQIRLAWTESPNEMRVSWVTFIDYGPKIAVKSAVCEENIYSNNWTIFSATTKLHDEGRDRSVIQYIHTVVIKNIIEECVYDYLVANACFWSSKHTFKGRTPYISKPIPNSLSLKPTKMLVVGDWGAQIWGLHTKIMLESHTKAEQIDFILHIGDIAYNLDFDDGQTGDDFFTMIEPLSSELPYMVIPGNHDTKRNFTYYSERFQMPINEANDGKSLFYSYNLGPVHFLMMNLNYYFGPHCTPCAETHRNWVKDDLAKANEYRDQVPWVIAFSHQAFYCSVNNTECYEEADKVKEEFEDIFREYEVDLVVQGHVHNYERDLPLYKGKIMIGEFDIKNMHFNPRAPVYIVNGNGGNRLMLNDPFLEQKPEFFVYGEQGFGYGKITAFNKTHLLYDQYSSDKNLHIDYVWIVKDGQYKRDYII